MDMIMDKKEDSLDRLTIYDKKVNQFVRKYFVKNNRYNELYLARHYIEEEREIRAYICSLLLYYDSVCFDVYGENIIVPYLIGVFGKKGFDNLIEQKAVRFLLSTSMITHSVNPIQGLHPLQYGTLTTEVHSNPEDSISSGLKWSSNSFDRSYHRSLTRKLTKLYNVHPKGVSSRIVSSVYQGYKDNLFAKLGLAYEQELDKFDKSQCEKIGTIAQYYMDLALISYYQYTSIDNYPLDLLNTEQLEHLKYTQRIKNYTNKTFEFEKIPNFEELLSSGVLKVEDIPEFRKKTNSEKFRKWIATVSQNDFDSFDVKEYLDSIESHQSFWQTNSARALKTISVNIVSTLISCLTGDPCVLGTSIALLDEFYINSLIKNWSPRFFFKEASNYLNENKQVK